MKPFFKVMSIEEVLTFRTMFGRVEKESVPLNEVLGRVLAENIVSNENVPGFARSTMDGYALQAASTYGASEGSPALVRVIGNVVMGAAPDFSVGPGEAAAIPTGGMLPLGADSVVMIEHTEAVDDSFVEIYRSTAPLSHVVEPGEDLKEGQTLLRSGICLRPQDLALLASVGRPRVPVFKCPKIGIVATGDEVVPKSTYHRTAFLNSRFRYNPVIVS